MTEKEKDETGLLVNHNVNESLKWWAQELKKKKKKSGREKKNEKENDTLVARVTIFVLKFNLI